MALLQTVLVVLFDNGGIADAHNHSGSGDPAMQLPVHAENVEIVSPYKRLRLKDLKNCYSGFSPRERLQSLDLHEIPRKKFDLWKTHNPKGTA